MAGNTTASASGEVLFTQYGLSGTAVLDVSESLSVAFNREGKTDVSLTIDFVPWASAETLAREFRRRLEAGWAAGDLAAGILPDKFSSVMAGGDAPGARGERDKARALAGALKSRAFKVLGTRGWNEAEFTAGGVDAREIDPHTLESRRRKGLFLAGEIIDVQGERGGYNLAWAWASGYIAGLTDPKIGSC